MKIAVIGSRGINTSEAKETIREALVEMGCKEVISGGAMGVSLLAEEVAKEENYKLEVHKPDYKTYGKKAPHVRSSIMMKSCDRVLALWDGKSKGTGHELTKARRAGKKDQVDHVFLINFSFPSPFSPGQT